MCTLSLSHSIAQSHDYKSLTLEGESINLIINYITDSQPSKLQTSKPAIIEIQVIVCI